jgi:hypothetical protein
VSDLDDVVRQQKKTNQLLQELIATIGSLEGTIINWMPNEPDLSRVETLLGDVRAAIEDIQS